MKLWTGGTLAPWQRCGWSSPLWTDLVAVTPPCARVQLRVPLCEWRVQVQSCFAPLGVHAEPAGGVIISLIIGTLHAVLARVCAYCPAQHDACSIT